MANFLQNFAASTARSPLIRPQLLAATANGTGVSVDAYGANNLSAILEVGAVTGLTTFDVRLQSSDALAGTYTDIPGAAFVQVVAANQSQTIDFSLPPVLTATAAAPIFVRTVATLVGTSVNVYCGILGARDISGTPGYVNTPPPIN